MYKVSQETLSQAHKPYDVVTDKKGNVGFIQEVQVNECQVDGFISYAVNWMVGDNDKHAWFDHHELTVHCNIFVKIAESSCHPSGNSRDWAQRILFKPDS